MDEMQKRLEELEIRLAFQDELLSSLNDTVAQMRQLLDVQQAQLRLLYAKIRHSGTEAGDGSGACRLADEVPPHY